MSSNEFSPLNARDLIVAEVYRLHEESEFKDVPIHGNNGPKPNLDELQQVINYEIEYSSSEQVTISERPIDRTWGYIEFHFGIKEGQGSRQILGMQSYFKSQLKARQLGAVKTLIPSPGKPVDFQGWVFETLYVPFYFDSLPAAKLHP